MAALLSELKLHLAFVLLRLFWIARKKTKRARFLLCARRTFRAEPPRVCLRDQEGPAEIADLVTK